MEQLFKGIFFLLKPLLYPLSLIYGFAAWLRNRAYDKEIYSSIEFSIPVISIGNLSVGGTGKTPHVEYIIRLLQYEYRVATMSRGYKRRTKGFRIAGGDDSALTLGDEPYQFFVNFPDVYVSVAEDRMAGIPELMNHRPDTEIILLDDAYQHRSVKPGLNILLMDYNNPFYNDYILPFGKLREARSGYKRADIIVVTKVPEGCTDSELDEIETKVNPTEDQKLYFSKITYGEYYDFHSAGVKSISSSTKVILVSGMAHPEPMLDYVRSQAEAVHHLSYPDHHYFSERDLEEIKTTWKNWEGKEKVIVVSEKDAVRLHLKLSIINNDQEWRNIPIYILPIKIDFINRKGKGVTSFNQDVLGYIEQEKEKDFWSE